MAKKNHTKKALISSLLALFICFTMLIGTTFAWFTDTAATGRNTIKSGNLDMKLSYKPYGAENTTWTDVTEDTVIFGKDALYEPGYTEAVWLKVENLGSLAFRYNLAVNISSEKPGKNQAGEEFNLSDYLKVRYLTVTSTDMEKDYYTTRESLDSFGWGNAANSGETAFENRIAVINNGVAYSATDATYSEYSSSYVLVVISMPTTVGNEANHNGTDIPEINFSLTAVATQLPHEADSFGSDYDANADYPEVVLPDHFVSTSAELVEAFEKGGNIKLEGDITLDAILNLAEGKEVYLDMNGKTLTANDASVDPVFYTYKGSTLTIDGNGTVEITEPSMSLIFPGGDVVIENGTFIRTVPAGTPAKQVGALIVGAKVSPWGSQTVTINGGYFDGGYYDVNADDIDELLAGTKTLTETADDIAKRGNSADKNAVRVALKSNTQLTLNLSSNLMKVYGGTFVGMNPAWGDEGCMLPTTPNYLRPWSYYQGALLDGQTFNENGIVLPEGYSITKGATDDGRPTYTVTYSK